MTSDPQPKMKMKNKSYFVVKHRNNFHRPKIFVLLLDFKIEKYPNTGMFKKNMHPISSLSMRIPDLNFTLITVLELCSNSGDNVENWKNMAACCKN